MIDPANYAEVYAGILDDFWRRGVSRPTHTLQLEAFGYPLVFNANRADLLDIARYGQTRYSRVQRSDAEKTIRIDFVLDPTMGEKDLPAHLPSHIRYLAMGNFLTISAEPWFQASANLENWEGYALISERVAEIPKIMSRYILDCFVSNMILRTGWGQLHASCVYKNDKAILLSAPHNSGKSTTAFRLMNAGYGLLSDGMTYVEVEKNRVMLMGYPVGEIKLRKDIAEKYRHLTGHLEPTLVRNEKKLVVDLRQAFPERVLDRAILPKRTVICLLERAGDNGTSVEEIDRTAALAGLWKEALHLDHNRHLENNLHTIWSLVEQSACYRMRIGTNVESILTAVDRL